MWQRSIFVFIIFNWCWILLINCQLYNNNNNLEDGAQNADWSTMTDYEDLDETDFLPDYGTLTTDQEEEDNFGYPNQVLPSEWSFGNLRRLKKNWLETLWAKKELSKRRLSAGEILQILKQATQLQGHHLSRGKLKGMRFGVSRKRNQDFN